MVVWKVKNHMNNLPEKNQEMFHRVVQLIGPTLAKMTPQTIPDDQFNVEWPYKASFLFFTAKAFKSYQAIYTLCSNGFFQDAAILHRTIFEIFLQALYMAEDHIRRAELFKNHDIAERYFRYLKLSKFPDLVSSIERQESALEELKSQFSEIEEEYKKNKGWWGSDLRWLAEHVQSDDHAAEKNYLKLYPLFSELVHSTSPSVKYYISNENAFHVDYGPSQAYERLASFPVATTTVLLTVHVAASAWGLAEEARSLYELAKEVPVISE
jgi:hypothetical protein